MLRVAEVMQRNLRTISEDAPISEAILMLADGHVSGLPVLNAHHQLVGLISTTDILSAEAETGDASALGRIVTDTLVRDLMTGTPKTIEPDATVKLAAQEMLYLDVHRLLVVQDSTLLGVISQSDIVRAVAEGQL